MTEPLTLTAALVAGLVTSVHCVGMCGPIACSLGRTDLPISTAFSLGVTLELPESKQRKLQIGKGNVGVSNHLDQAHKGRIVVHRYPTGYDRISGRRK